MQINRIATSWIVAYCAKYVNILENIFLKNVLRADDAAATNKAPGKQGFPGALRLLAVWRGFLDDAGFAPAVVGLVIVIQADAEGRHPQQQRRQHRRDQDGQHLTPPPQGGQQLLGAHGVHIRRSHLLGRPEPGFQVCVPGFGAVGLRLAAQSRQQLLFVFSGTGQIAADGPDISVDLPLSFPHGGTSSRMMAVTPVIMDSYSRIISSSRASPAGSRW